MDFLPEHIAEYSEKFSSAEDPILSELARETWEKVLMPRMLSGQLQGLFLEQVARMIKPQFILELGTYTGYSALCMVKGLAEGGQLHSIDCNDELEPLVRKYIAKAGAKDKITLHYGEALNVLPELLHLPFNLVFLDADKENYLFYLKMLLPALPSGAFILADNVLWSGKVADSQSVDKETVALREFNAFVANSGQLRAVLLPFRDGITLMEKM
jgi:caffeoyl-CoA O-methyltransferase